jgi:hypothetical protein
MESSYNNTTICGRESISTMMEICNINSYELIQLRATIYTAVITVSNFFQSNTLLLIRLSKIEYLLSINQIVILREHLRMGSCPFLSGAEKRNERRNKVNWAIPCQPPIAFTHSRHSFSSLDDYDQCAFLQRSHSLLYLPFLLRRLEMKRGRSKSLDTLNPSPVQPKRPVLILSAHTVLIPLERS